ncbi:MAG: ATP-dependent helicase [Acidimicrobiia bacterium]
MHLPGPAELGRGVVIEAGGAVPDHWARAERVVIDDAAIADPTGAVARLHACWAKRRPVVIELAVDPETFRSPATEIDPPWVLGPGYTPWKDRLHFLAWANTYDARNGEPVWWWGRKASRLGATATGEDMAGDVVLADGTPVWIDGGPRMPHAVPLAGAGVVHADSVALGRLVPQPPPTAPIAHLAPDQLAAVAHRAGPARIVAPAGSGKTRVLTERLRHLLADRLYEPEIVLALAYNKQAQLEMAARTDGLGARIQTLNAWGYELVTHWLGRRPPVLEEREVRSIVEGLVPRQRRRVNTDPLARYLEGLSLIRLGLRHPQRVENDLGDVPGLAAAFEPYRAELRRRGALDFDEQVFVALEALVGDGEFRRAIQAAHRHVLVDELQDLTPAHVLLLRLVSCPAYDVFGVGDDDQTIYDHAGADPRFLIDFGTFFPEAASHALEVNYRCPVAVTSAAATMLGYNQRRVDKVIRPGPEVVDDPDAFGVETHRSEAGAATLVETVGEWLSEPGVDSSQIAVLTRVQSLLLAPHVALIDAGVTVDSIIDETIMSRLGVRAALAYVRIAVDPENVNPLDLVEVHRRPSRGLPTWAEKWLGRCRSIPDLERAASRIDDAKVGAKLDDLAYELALLGQLAAGGASARVLLTAVRDEIGLGSAMTLLDSSGGAAASHLDDLEALLQVADLHPEAASFEGWLRRSFHRQRTPGGVSLSTIHRVKGREWPRVIVFGVTDGIVPHRLSEDIESERRVLHVGITRGSERVRVLGAVDRRSPFLDEFDGRAPRLYSVPGNLPHSSRRDARSVSDAESPLTELAIAALKEWRLERSRADGVPAFVVLSDVFLIGIAERRPVTLSALRNCPGIGPSKLESYGEEILEILSQVQA